MDYTINNKEAWEEAFKNHKEGWGDDINSRLANENLPFIEGVLAEELTQYDFRNKAIAQFCCNNGRELMGLMKLGAFSGTGFDIAENMIDFANKKAGELNLNCSFIATDIRDIRENYNNSFDYIFITIGALAWFRDLKIFFEKAAACLKPHGLLFINEMHPVTGMFGVSGEENFNESMPEKIVNSYFKEDPWIESNGMGYMCGKAYESKTFYSYSHTLSDIINGIIQNGMNITKLKEFDYDISESFQELNNKGIPLSFLLVSKKI